MQKFNFLILSLLVLLGGCNFVASPESIRPEPVPDLFNENLNNDLSDADNFSDWEFYSLELGRTDPDIQSQKTYTFYLPKDFEFELMGVDAQSTIIEFKKDNQVIFSWNNRDYVIEENNLDKMYPEWNNYSFVGGHTNVLFFDEEKNADHEDDLHVFENSLKVDNQFVFE
ncbi:MAG: hypothetical protein GF365_04405 [Candidatus Buchananbacteria bacterium]|nr:hypothetical protein [Candidatus Buchananbacteria bacterium]